VNSSSIPGPPNSPGGRLIACTTINSIGTPAGRSSRLGEAMNRTPRAMPLGSISI